MFFGGLPPVFGLHVLFSPDGRVFIGSYCSSSLLLIPTLCTEYRLQVSHPPLQAYTPVLTTTSIFLRPLVPFSSSHVHRPSLNPSSLSLRPDRPLSKDTPFHFSPIIRSLGGLTAVRLIIPPRRPYIPVILLDMVVVFICVHL